MIRTQDRQWSDTAMMRRRFLVIAAIVFITLLLIFAFRSNDGRIQPRIIKWPDVIGATSLIFSSDGRTIATTVNHSNVRVWDLRTGEVKREVVGASSIAFSPDGRMLAATSPAQPSEGILVWNLKSGQRQRRLSGHKNWVSSVAFSSDGKTIISGSEDSTVKLWNSMTGKLKRTLPGHSGSVTAVAFSPDGKLIASGSKDKTVKLWSAQKGAPVRLPLMHKYGVACVAFSPDGLVLACGGGQLSKMGELTLWNVETRQRRSLRGILSRHTDMVASLAFSPDGRMLASADWDMTVRIWDVSTRPVIFYDTKSWQQKIIVQGHEGPIGVPGK